MRCVARCWATAFFTFSVFHLILLCVGNLGRKLKPQDKPAPTESEAKAEAQGAVPDYPPLKVVGEIAAKKTKKERDKEDEDRKFKVHHPSTLNAS